MTTTLQRADGRKRASCLLREQAPMSLGSVYARRLAPPRRTPGSCPACGLGPKKCCWCGPGPRCCSRRSPRRSSCRPPGMGGRLSRGAGCRHAAVKVFVYTNNEGGGNKYFELSKTNVMLPGEGRSTRFANSLGEGGRMGLREGEVVATSTPR